MGSPEILILIFDLWKYFNKPTAQTFLGKFENAEKKVGKGKRDDNLVKVLNTKIVHEVFLNST